MKITNFRCEVTTGLRAKNYKNSNNYVPNKKQFINCKGISCEPTRKISLKCL